MVKVKITPKIVYNKAIPLKNKELFLMIVGKIKRDMVRTDTIRTEHESDPNINTIAGEPYRYFEGDELILVAKVEDSVRNKDYYIVYDVKEKESFTMEVSLIDIVRGEGNIPVIDSELEDALF